MEPVSHSFYVKDKYSRFYISFMFCSRKVCAGGVEAVSTSDHVTEAPPTSDQRARALSA